METCWNTRRRKTKVAERPEHVLPADGGVGDRGRGVNSDRMRRKEEKAEKESRGDESN